jgi:hypothetical protein
LSYRVVVRVGTINEAVLNKYEQGLMKPEGTTLGLLAKALSSLIISTVPTGYS